MTDQEQAQHIVGQIVAGLRETYGAGAVEAARDFRRKAVVNPSLWDRVIAALGFEPDRDLVAVVAHCRGRLADALVAAMRDTDDEAEVDEYRGALDETGRLMGLALADVEAGDLGRAARRLASARSVEEDHFAESIYAAAALAAVRIAA